MRITYQVGCVDWFGESAGAVVVYCDNPRTFEVVIYDDLTKLLGWILVVLEKNRGDPGSVWGSPGIGAQVFFAASTHCLLTDAAHTEYDPEDGKQPGEMI